MAKAAKPQTSVPRGRRTYTAEFKRHAVQLLRERRADGAPLAQIARELDVGVTLLCAWARALDGRGTGRRDVPGVAPPGETLEEEVRRLRREVATLRMERDFAKKAAVGSTGECNSA